MLHHTFVLGVDMELATAQSYLLNLGSYTHQIKDITVAFGSIKEFLKYRVSRKLGDSKHSF